MSAKETAIEIDPQFKVLLAVLIAEVRLLRETIQSAPHGTKSYGYASETDVERAFEHANRSLHLAR